MLFVIVNIIGYVFSFAILNLIPTYIGSQALVIYVGVVSALPIVVAISKFGYDISLLKYVTEYTAKYGKSYGRNHTVEGLASLSAFVIGTFLYAFIYNSNGVGIDLKSIAIVGLIFGIYLRFTFSCTRLRIVHKELFSQLLLKNIFYVVLIVFLYVFSLFRKETTDILYAYLIAIMVVYLTASIFLSKYETKPLVEVPLKSLVDYGKSPWATSILIQLVNNVDTLMVIKIFGGKTASTYFVCKKISSLLLFFNGIISSRYSRLIADGLARGKLYEALDKFSIFRMMQYVYLAVMMFILVSFDNEVVLFLLHDADIILIDSISLMFFLAALVQGFIGVTNTILNQSNHSSILTKSTFFILLVIFLNVLIQFEYQDIELFVFFNSSAVILVSIYNYYKVKRIYSVWV